MDGSTKWVLSDVQFEGVSGGGIGGGRRKFVYKEMVLGVTSEAESRLSILTRPPRFRST